VKLWPHARKKGHEIGEHWRVGYYSKQDGPDLIWLVDDAGSYRWTIDQAFLDRYFEVIEASKEKSYYGDNREKLGAAINGKALNLEVVKVEFTTKTKPKESIKLSPGKGVRGKKALRAVVDR
jgi:hypothetical protein